MASASRGEMPKNAGSNSATPSRNPPSATYEVPAWPEPVSSMIDPRSQPRSVGKGAMASTPSWIIRHRAAGLCTPPGNRQLMPTTAIGSVLRASISRSRSWAASRSVLTRLRK